MSTAHMPPLQEATDAPLEATRHLCAGVYLNEKFRHLVVKEVCTTPYRRVAPSYGFDLVPVMRHAWCAMRLAALPRFMTALAVLVPLVLGNLVAMTLTSAGLIVVCMLPRLREQLGDVAGATTGRGGPHGQSLRARRGNAHVTSRAHAMRALQRTGGRLALLVGLSALLAVHSPDQGLLALMVLGLIMLSSLLAGAVRQVQLNRIRITEDLRPITLSKREAAVAHQQGHACVVFERPYHLEGDEFEAPSTPLSVLGRDSPFIGAGTLIHEWNPPMNVQLLRAGSEEEPLHEREYATPPFRAHELVDHLRLAVLQLQYDDMDIRLPATVRDRVYIAENDASADRELLGDEQVDTTRMQRIINGLEPRRHHFLEVTVPTTGGELVATVLLQVRVQGRTLSLAFAACALTRTPRRFQQMNEFGQHGNRAIAWSALQELSKLPRRVATWWKISYYPYFLAKAIILGPERTLRPRRNVHIGTRVSVREEPAEEWNSVLLDQTDILRQVKSVEQRLLASCSSFLQGRNLDTSEFEKHANKIINNSFNMGNNNNFNNSAVGNGAQSNNTLPQQDGQPPSDNGGKS